MAEKKSGEPDGAIAKAKADKKAKEAEKKVRLLQPATCAAAACCLPLHTFIWAPSAAGVCGAGPLIPRKRH